MPARFRNASKKSSEGYSEFAYGLKTNLIEWLKSEEVYESLRQVKLWVQDRVGVDCVERAAELAEEYATRRKLSGEESERGRSDQRKTFRQGNDSRENGPEKPEAGQKVPEKSAEHSNGDEARKSPTGQFEARKPFLCYNCQEPGHTEARCKKPRVVFSYVSGSDKDLKLLRPYLHELQGSKQALNFGSLDQRYTSLVPELRLGRDNVQGGPGSRRPPLIEKQDTNMRQSVKPDTRFELTLRFLATDARYNFVYVDASSCGSASDGGVWSRTPLGKQIASGSANLLKAVGLPNSQLPAVIVGDDAFPLGEHLMKPHSKNKLSNDEVTFNERLSQSRRVVENSYGQLANRFRVYHTIIYAQPDSVRALIKATCILDKLLNHHPKTPRINPQQAQCSL
ncbi:hypothetical protein HPB47_004606 [Ixodes persulcatus]|uniref:Uncharacterized protein n=1 Tax=Ixodes persulcatus TaxID=34615 RepID=A0AC60PF82_IXOPE|nr:hypothetical protein HPB47_004606 [Ixodes persulcatus]